MPPAHDPLTFALTHPLQPRAMNHIDVVLMAALMPAGLQAFDGPSCVARCSAFNPEGPILMAFQTPPFSSQLMGQVPPKGAIACPASYRPTAKADGDDDATCIIEAFLGNLEFGGPAADEDLDVAAAEPAVEEDPATADVAAAVNLAVENDAASAGAATFAAMPFVNHAADDIAAAVGPTSTPSNAGAAATRLAALDATGADEVWIASDATVTDVTPTAQPADEPIAINTAATPAVEPIDGMHAAAALGAIPVVAPTADDINLAAIEKAVTVGNLVVDNDPDAMALADGPRGDEPAVAKIAASLTEEDEAAQDGAEIVAAPNLAIGEVACMSHPSWMTAPCLPAAEAHLWHFEPQVAYLEAHLPKASVHRTSALRTSASRSPPACNTALSHPLHTASYAWNAPVAPNLATHTTLPCKRYGHNADDHSTSSALLPAAS
ncbi:hypothetical protein L7F22_054704 [Adiantum nelumboides]|nr:hypothetical protein [Adiantum nelumboides]